MITWNELWPADTMSTRKSYHISYVNNYHMYTASDLGGLHTQKFESLKIFNSRRRIPLRGLNPFIDRIKTWFV